MLLKKTYSKEEIAEMNIKFEDIINMQDREKINKTFGSKIIKRLKKIDSGLNLINNRYIGTIDKNVKKALAIPICVHINNYENYLRSLYDLGENKDLPIISNNGENIEIVNIDTIERIYLSIVDGTINSFSSEGLSILLKLQNNALTSYIENALNKVGSNYLDKIIESIDFSVISFEDSFYINKKDIYINKFKTAVYA